jgi:hypothetical protein
MKHPDKYSSIFFLLLSVAVCAGSLYLPAGTVRRPGPMVFPLLLGVALGVLSITLLLQVYFRRSSTDSSLRFDRGEIPKVIYTMVVFFLSTFIFEEIGFVLSIFILLVLILVVIGHKTILKSSLYGVVFSLASYLFMTRFFGVRLPKGLLWF